MLTNVAITSSATYAPCAFLGTSISPLHVDTIRAFHRATLHICAGRSGLVDILEAIVEEAVGMWTQTTQCEIILCVCVCVCVRERERDSV